MRTVRRTIDARRRKETIDRARWGWEQYEIRKARWVEDHPDAGPGEYAAAVRAIADELGL